MPAEPELVRVGSSAPDFSLASTAGTVSLSDYQGVQHVLLVFMRAYG
jgi:peroxiredoxin